MDAEQTAERYGVLTIWVGIAFLACAALLTWSQCTLFSDLNSPRYIVWRQAFCPATVPVGYPEIVPGRLFFTKLFAFWMFAGGTVLFGLCRVWFERRPPPADPMVKANEAIERRAQGFRRRVEPPAPDAPAILPATYIVPREEREALRRAIAEACAKGDLAGARARLAQAVAATGDLELQAALAEGDAASLDWPRIAAEAIAADSAARARGEAGVDSVIIELGNHTESRTKLSRTYRNRATPQTQYLARYWAHEQPMELSGIAALAKLESPGPIAGENLEAASTRRDLATQAIILSFFAAVKRHASGDGLPMRAAVRAEITYFRGPEAIFQLGPAIAFDTEAGPKAPGAAVIEAAEALQARVARSYFEATSRLIERLLSTYERAGYVPTRGLPEALGETLVRLRDIEDRLIQDQLRGAVRPAEFAEIVKAVRSIREDEAPGPLDLSPYR